jgi:hypothetical protein
MAGISPNLPDDTKSRSIRILLMPDLDGVVEDSDWEFIEDDAADLGRAIEQFADAVRESVSGMKVHLPTGCIGRAKEKWRPLKRVAVAAGGHWPAIADELILRSLAEDADERDAGLGSLPPAMVLLTDLHAVWPDQDDFVPTKDLVSKVVFRNAEYWGERSPYGKALTETRFGKLIAQASKVTSQRPGGRGPRGYHRLQFAPVWHRLGIGRIEPGAPGEPGEPGADNRDNRDNRLHRDETTPLCRCGADLLEDNHSGMCAECTLIAKQSAVADRAGHLDGESA